MLDSSLKNVQAAGRATRGFFLLCGIGAASWAPMVPFAKDRLALDEAQLGVVLLCMGVGSTVSMPLAGWVTQRHGSRVVLPISAALVCVALPLLAIAPSTAALAAALALFGAGLGVMDVAMNAHAVEVERLHGSPLMSGFHALYSVGGLAGSAGMSALLTTGVPLVGCATGIAVLLLAVVATQSRHLLAATTDRAATRSMFALPSATAVSIGLLCLVLFLAEGAMLDWSAELLRSARGVARSDTGVGYAAFSIAMAAGRLLGDRLTAALGPTRIVRHGSLIAAAGFVLAAALPWPATSLIGFVLVGIGAANIVPVLFSAAGRLPGTAPGVAIATVTTFGYTGLLTGPALIGLVARAVSLPVALGGVAILLVAVSASASIARRDRSAP
ncbi:MAG TPA: MFS transporter [Kofleriaceae bacterium]|nr:MFS transporter [Kofleriaceae bacterium]